MVRERKQSFIFTSSALRQQFQEDIYANNESANLQKAAE